MGKVLRMLQLRIRTDQGWQDPPYDLDAQIVAITGPADTGKTSFAESLRFGLGDDFHDWRGVVDLHLREVALEIRLGNRTYTLRRARSSSSIVTVTDEVGDLEGRFPVRASAGNTSLSDWLLNELGLAEDFRATGGRLDFHSGILPFLFLDQDHIDQYVIMPENRDDVRVTALKLMLGLTNPARQARLTQIRRLEAEIRSRENRARVVERFLSEHRVTTASAVQDELAAMATRRAEAEQRVQELRAAASAGIADAQQWQTRLREANTAVARAEIDLADKRKKHEKAQNDLDKVNELLRALSIIEDADPADRTTLELYSEKNCISCAQPLDMQREPGACQQCGQPLPGHKQLARRVRLQQQHQEAEGELTATEDQLSVAQLVADKASAALGELLALNHEQTKDAVAPHLDAVAAASAELARIVQRITDLRELAESLQRLTEERTQIAELRSKRDALAAESDDPDVGIFRPEQVFDWLNEAFHETLKTIELPGYQGRAYIDPDLLLPYIDGMPFKARGGGGRTAVSIAYSLTLLTEAIEDDLTTLPGMLVIDSPKKGLGATNKEDRQFARRVYSRFIEAMRRRGLSSDGRYERPFQLIIIDNDKPIVPGVKIIHEFTRESGFIKKLPKAGSGQEILFE
ncbi:hypothetical protein [Actinomadura chibensis]|uniref:Uncharacterized protein n=1 Tax=Actinomadura chibensis TaxID=392828 RepID=A0A5D0NXG1_9ACTN|nr:hypothetical protein [Actinomadura chibensis]TYB49320.1 hypothetical protein FXF69_09555 [Actinomadura chibensis]